LRVIKPAPVVAIALDTSALRPEEAQDAIAQTKAETGLPVDDPVRSGGARLWHAIREAVLTVPR
jgi:uncharacterized NAD-dependent epimerase/dehydratase family protein